MSLNLRSIIVLVCVISILSQPLFFSFMGLLGIEYEGIDSSPVYVIFIVTSFVFVFLAFAYSIFKKGLLKQELKLLVFFLLLFALHSLWVIFDPINTKMVPEFLMFSVLFGLPGFFAAATIIKLNLIIPFVRATEVSLIVIAFGIVIFSVVPSLAGIRTTSLAGASYQALSYYSAFTFGMLLIYVTQLPKSLRFSWSKSIWYVGFLYIIMMGCVLGVFLGGGRGAFLLLIVYLLVHLFSIIQVRKRILSRRAVFNGLIKLLVIFFSFILFLNYFWEADFVQAGFSRATQFISSDGRVDLESGSSGRDTVYRVAIDYIIQNPIFGYGPFSFREKTIHAHNLFLEILLQLGVLGLITFIVLIAVLAVNAKKNWSIYSYWVLHLLFYPLVMLMFSGAYLHTAIFLFCISFLVIFKKNIYKNNISFK